MNGVQKSLRPGNQGHALAKRADARLLKQLLHIHLQPRSSLDVYMQARP